MSSVSRAYVHLNKRGEGSLQGFPQFPNPYPQQLLNWAPGKGNLLPTRDGRAQVGVGLFKSVALRRWDGEGGHEYGVEKSEHGEQERGEKVRKVSEGRGRAWRRRGKASTRVRRS